MDFVVVIAAVAGLICGLALAVRGSLLAGCVLYLAMVSCFGPNFLQFKAAGMSLSLDRVYLVGLIGAYLLQRFFGATDSKPWQGADVWLGAFVGMLTLSTFTHDWQITQDA